MAHQRSLRHEGATAISRRFALALAWLATGALLGTLLPVLGVAVIVAFNAVDWLPIRGESPLRGNLIDWWVTAPLAARACARCGGRRRR
jgi:hypothetical protein